MPAMNYFLSVYRLIDILVIYVATYKSEITFKDFRRYAYTNKDVDFLLKICQNSLPKQPPLLL
jgi:hypothetical protein